MSMNELVLDYITGRIARALAFIVLLAALLTLAVCAEQHKRYKYAEAVVNEIERRNAKALEAEDDLRHGAD